MAKLYPPTIPSAIPSFYAESNGEAVISVPFSMNRAVNINEVSGYALKIKTAQTNSQLKIIENGALADNCVQFSVYVPPNSNDVSPISDGTELLSVTAPQYLKVQLAYKDATGEVGYFSTPAIIKFTAKPEISVERSKQFAYAYKGIYTLGNDKTERPYMYKFSLWDRTQNLIETSGWLLHNSTLDGSSLIELDVLDEIVDFYTFTKVAPESSAQYTVQYSVKTINDLEISATLIETFEAALTEPLLKGTLTATNIFSDGYVLLVLSPTISANSQEFQANSTIEIQRAEYKDNYKTWKTLQQVYFKEGTSKTTWEFRDMTIEQGVKYQYRYREYGDDGSYSSAILSNTVYADFEDMFLSDGKRQLKIRLNPKVSSFKITRLEQKIDTIGSQYPFIFRNGIVGYKEFPIAGLISYQMDENEMFLDHSEDLNIIMSSDNIARSSFPVQETFDINGEEQTISFNQKITPVDQSIADTEIGKSWDISETLDSVGYNIMAERRFKTAVLNWLEDGNVKLFRSATEGNFLVRLLNVSLTPEDRLGRMLHNFTATAYEMYELTYENLLKLSFIDIDDLTEYVVATKTIKIADIIENSNVNSIDSISLLENGENIWQTLIISPANNATASDGNLDFYLRIGPNNPSNRTLITSSTPLVITGDESFSASGLYINTGDNAGLLSSDTNKTIKQRLKDLVADTMITYGYRTIRKLKGDFINKDSVKEETKVETLYRPDVGSINFETTTIVSGSTITTHEILEILHLEFQKKNIVEVTTDAAGQYFDQSNNLISTFSKMELYKIGNSYYYGTGESNLKPANQLSSSQVDELYHVVVTKADGTIETYSDIPSINFNIYSPSNLKSISFGYGVIAANYTYTTKTTSKSS